MNFVKYCPIVPEEPQPESRMSQWSQGIAMFAAFVIPFILLLTSARYRVFLAQAKHQIEVVSQGPLNSLYGGSPHTEKQP
jgi:hypothetical protein